MLSTQTTLCHPALSCPPSDVFPHVQAAIAEQQLRNRGDTETKLVPFAEKANKVGLDLEYAVRAWCVLERCYLPESGHKDKRMQTLIKATHELHANAKLAAKKTMSSSKTGKGTDDAEPIAKLINTLEWLQSVLDLCQATSKNRTIYQNAWAYHYLKKRVLRVTRVEDYQYLDKLFVKDLALDNFGILYLQSVAGNESLEGIRDPQMAWLSGGFMPPVNLRRLVGGLMSGKEWRQYPDEATFNCAMLKVDQVFSQFGGALVVKVEHVDNSETYQHAILQLSDVGICGGRPRVANIEVWWQGLGRGVRGQGSLKVNIQSERQWTLQDRTEHDRLVALATSQH